MVNDKPEELPYGAVEIREGDFVSGCLGTDSKQ